MQDLTTTKESNAVCYHVLGKSVTTQQVSMIYFIAVHRRGIDEELVFTTNHLQITGLKKSLDLKLL